MMRKFLIASLCALSTLAFLNWEARETPPSERKPTEIHMGEKEEDEDVSQATARLSRKNFQPDRPNPAPIQEEIEALKEEAQKWRSLLAGYDQLSSTEALDKSNYLRLRAEWMRRAEQELGLVEVSR